MLQYVDRNQECSHDLPQWRGGGALLICAKNFPFSSPWSSSVLRGTGYTFSTTRQDIFSCSCMLVDVLFILSAFSACTPLIPITRLNEALMLPYFVCFFFSSSASSSVTSPTCDCKVFALRSHFYSLAFIA